LVAEGLRRAIAMTFPDMGGLARFVRVAMRAAGDGTRGLANSFKRLFEFCAAAHALSMRVVRTSFPRRRESSLGA